MKQSFLFILLLIVFSSCDFSSEKVRGNGAIKSENRSLNGFTAISVAGSMKVYVTQGPEYTVRIETDENLLGLVETRVDGSELKIRPRQHYGLNPTGEIKVYVSAPELKRLEASGACNIFTSNKITSGRAVEVELSGASYAEVEVNAPEISADLSGASAVQLAGETREFSIDGSGSSQVRAYELKAENVDMEISGAGGAEVFASVKLDAHLSGAATAHYKGKAAVSQHVSGAASVNKVD